MSTPTENEAFLLKKPCDKCPFSVRCEPGGTGGASPMTYVGQIFAGMWLPCHKKAGFDAEGRCNIDGKISQCAGAAIARSNFGVAEQMSPATHVLPESDLAFRTPVALISHHAKISTTQAELLLSIMSPHALAQIELNAVRRQLLLVERPNAEGEAKES